MIYPPLPEPAAVRLAWADDSGDENLASWVQWHDEHDPAPESWDDEPPAESTPFFSAKQMGEFAVAVAVAMLHEMVDILADENAAEPHEASGTK